MPRVRRIDVRDYAADDADLGRGEVVERVTAAYQSALADSGLQGLPPTQPGVGHPCRRQRRLATGRRMTWLRAYGAICWHGRPAAPDRLAPDGADRRRSGRFLAGRALRGRRRP